MHASSPPVPRKIAEQIWKGQYNIELKKLLPANLGAPEPTILISWENKRRPGPRKASPALKNGPYVLMLLLAMRQPERGSDLLAYSSTIIRASIDYEDTPWLAYHAHFCRQAATNPRSRWAQLDAALWTVYFTRARPKNHTIDRMHKPGEKTRSSPYTMSVCRKWNSTDGCNVPFCRYRHCCYKCNYTTHKAIHCPGGREQQSGGLPPPFRPGPSRP